jgi:hypothetical protein
MPVTPTRYSILGLTLSVLAIVLSSLVDQPGMQADRGQEIWGPTAEFEMIDAGFVPARPGGAPPAPAETLNC